MHLRSLTSVATVFLVVASSAVAQYPPGAAGFLWIGGSGTYAGYACWGFSCTPEAVGATAGESVTLRVSGEVGGAYLMALSTSASSCVSVPGILNQLVLDQPVILGPSGFLSNFSPILACPGGYDTVTTVFPSGLPLGASFAIQALTFGAGNVLALTGAIVVTVV